VKSKLDYFLIIFLIFLASCSTHKIISHPLQQKIIVDGNYNEWKDTQLFLNKEPPFLLGAVNSSDHLYLLLRSNDATFMRQLRLLGFTLWLDEDKTLGLELPGRLRPSESGQRRRRPDEMKDGNMQRQRFALTTNDFFLIKKEKERLPLSVLPDFSIASGVEDGVSTLEFGIPISQEGTEDYRFSPQNGTFKIGLQLKMPSGNNLRQRQGRGRGGMRGGRSGLGVPGDHEQRPQGRKMITDNNLWFNIILQDR